MLSNQQTKVRTDEELAVYIDKVLLNLTYMIYQVTSWTLFAEHQLLFSFAISINILKYSKDEHKRISENALLFFLHSSIMTELKHETLSDKIDLIPDKKFVNELMLDDKNLKELLLLEDLMTDRFQGIIDSMQNFYSVFWVDFMKSPEPYEFLKKSGKGIFASFFSKGNLIFCCKI